MKVDRLELRESRVILNERGILITIFVNTLIENGMTDEAKNLIGNNHVDITTLMDYDYRTPLHVAAKMGNEEMI